MLQPVFRLLLFRGSPVDVNGSVPTIATFAILLIAFVWLTLPTGGIANLSQEVIADLRKVFMVIPLIAYALAVVMILTVLNVRKFSNRFSKTISACLGLLLLFQVSVFALDLMSKFLPSMLGFIFGILEMVLFGWFVGVGGYVFSHAFNVKLYHGVLAAIVILMLSIFFASIITGLVLPEELKTFAEIQSMTAESLISE